MHNHTETGGIAYGKAWGRSINLSWPFATLTAEADRLVLRASVGRLWSRTFSLERGQIVSIRKKRGFTASGIVIGHTEEGCPPYLVFWTLRYAALKEELEALGYRVE